MTPALIHVSHWIKSETQDFKYLQTVAVQTHHSAVNKSHNSPLNSLPFTSLITMGHPLV